MKTCSMCDTEKLSTEFHKDKNKRDGLQSRCKVCAQKSCYDWRRSNPEKEAKNQRKKNLKRNYGIDPDSVAKMRDGQSGLCAICGIVMDSGREENVDHCHNTGKVRGLLCNRCNLGLGYFKDSIVILTAAINYLSK